jgi:hypothetical protein
MVVLRSKGENRLKLRGLSQTARYTHCEAFLVPNRRRFGDFENFQAILVNIDHLQYEEDVFARIVALEAVWTVAYRLCADQDGLE